VSALPLPTSLEVGHDAPTIRSDQGEGPNGHLGSASKSGSLLGWPMPSIPQMGPPFHSSQQSPLEAESSASLPSPALVPEHWV
jgi:hypothetical protein